MWSRTTQSPTVAGIFDVGSRTKELVGLPVPVDVPACPFGDFERVGFGDLHGVDEVRPATVELRGHFCPFSS
jgi:hypothetical protein